MLAPKQCSQCTKSALICYTTITSKEQQSTYLCSECADKETSLSCNISTKNKTTTVEKISISCEFCNLSWESFLETGCLKCTKCYQAFKTLLIKHITGNKKLSKYHSNPTIIESLHTGRAKGESSQESETLKLLTLTQALNKNVLDENYEQAAIIRDQIETLKNKDL